MMITVQKLHTALQAGQRLTLAGTNCGAFSFQGAWDGGCALHAAAMAFGMLGHLARPIHVPLRRGGAEAAFWKRAEPYYLAGICLDELATLVWELNWGLRPVVFEGAHADVIRFCQYEFARGWPVIINWRERRRSGLHAVLVVGIEGQQTGRTFAPHTLLALDSAEAEPFLAGYNARLTWTSSARGKRSLHARYVAASGQRTIELVGALSFRQTAAAARRADQPP
ncbi:MULTISPECIES: hypothetical protein [Cupriavidus]